MGFISVPFLIFKLRLPAAFPIRNGVLVGLVEKQKSIHLSAKLLGHSNLVRAVASLDLQAAVSPGNEPGMISEGVSIQRC